ncbi:molybdopterin-containing oxidoreductase family protein [Marichromatium gracile]|uniref:Anaerobic selenocysteine-containing dehydrogenase n=1 Tax=Marichromatium gracile TaxID=1048 RepID=A0A4V2W9N0_MARGR|nr:molybdopterin-dependent oxidoreductase [Marichromatium gracile]MBK1709141.1 molybdopterin oxidoreductase [Marichromatium gracile]TCW36020.1 anaerobic selenocysteine-containing dehydrogenase [Marichromatium gracile]
MPSAQTTCYECDANCPIEIELDTAGEPVKVRGPDCPRCYVQLERRDHPERLLHPLRRIGPRGSGRFERIGWDEALDTIAAELTRARERHGAPAVGFFAGYTKEARPQLQRLAHSFGSPNYMTESGCCFSATMVAEKLTLGYKIKTTSTVVSPKTRCHLIWSTNPRGSIPPFDQHPLASPRPERALIVVDPRRTPLAERADVHLQIRPGTDGALALGFHHLIFANGWQDQVFLDQWGQGVDAFRDYVRDFDPRRVAAICGVAAADIERAAECYATTAPAQITLSPTATVQHSNGFQNHRALILLSAVTGNLDREGGNRFFNDKALPRPIERFDHCLAALPPRVGSERFPIWTRYWPAAQSMLLPDCILEGDPQPIRALLAMGINTAMWPNSARMERALGALDFFAASDFFHNPATRQADIVLPAATNLERPALIAYPGCAYQGEVRYRRALLAPRGEARADGEIFLQLGVRLGMGALFWDGDLEASWAEAAEGLPEAVREAIYASPEGVTVYADAIDDLVDHGFMDADRLYRLRGFPTDSGKVEFDSDALRAAGHDGLPVYREPAEGPVSTPALARRFPLVLTSGARTKFDTHSQHQHSARMRRAIPRPLVEIHPEDAMVRGIDDGDAVMVGSPRGEVRFYAQVTERIKPGVVHCVHGWNEANVNLLTDDVHLDPISGFPPFKSGLCEIRPLD